MLEYILSAVIMAIIILIYVLSQNKTEPYRYTLPPSEEDLKNLGKEFFDWEDFFNNNNST